MMAVSPPPPTVWSGHVNQSNITDRTRLTGTSLNCFDGSEEPTRRSDDGSRARRRRGSDEALRSLSAADLDRSVDGQQQQHLTPTPLDVTWGSQSRFHSNDNRSTFQPNSNHLQLVNCSQSIVSDFSATTFLTGSRQVTVDDDSSACQPTTSCVTRPTRTALCLLLSPLWNTIFKGFEFSRRRRFRFPNLVPSFPSMYIHVTTLVLIVSMALRAAEACSSRSTPKPRPPSSTMRPNITFPTYTCPPAYATWYCLNGATCFTVEISESILYNCVCAEGFTGPRCEFKDLDGSYLPSREKVMIEKASIASGVTIAILLMVIITIGVYVYSRRWRKEKAFDQVDSANLTPRPFTTLRSQSQRQYSLQRPSTSQSHSHPDVEAGSNVQREPSSSAQAYSSPPHLQVYNGASIASRGSQL